MIAVLFLVMGVSMWFIMYMIGVSTEGKRLCDHLLKLTKKGTPELDAWKLESDMAVAVAAERAACLQIVRGAVNKFAALAKLKAR